MTIDNPEATITLGVNESLLRSLAERGEAETVHVLGVMAAEQAAALLDERSHRARGGIITEPMLAEAGSPGVILNPTQTAMLGRALAKHPSSWVGAAGPNAAAIGAAQAEEKDRARALQVLRGELGLEDGVATSCVLEEAVEQLQKARLEASTRLLLADVRGRGRDRLSARLDKAVAERDVAVAEARKLIEQLGEAESRARIFERRAEATFPLERMIEIRNERDALRQQRDHARESAVMWANTPIHRLLEVYAAHHPRFAQPGSVRSLSITQRRVPAGDRWSVSWQVAVLPGWEDRSTGSPLFEEACTAAAEQIEAS